MRILSIVKQVPDSNASIKVLADGSGIDKQGVKLVPDPFDEFGIEEEIQRAFQRSPLVGTHDLRHRQRRPLYHDHVQL
ncbi:MAG: hypothetical protein IH987_15005 [Planctomycetes bacterium]|nr:hypothetical protein [Planctomycetota bacterium]